MRRRLFVDRPEWSFFFWQSTAEHDTPKEPVWMINFGYPKLLTQVGVCKGDR
jgi:hypothetical protein